MQHGIHETAEETGRLSYGRLVAGSLLNLFRAPYPRQYEKSSYTRDGSHIVLRPTKPDDADRLEAFFNGLSKRTIHYRFLANVETLPQEWIDHFTVIDYTRDVAVVATEGHGSEERFLGVGRIMRNSRHGKGEVALVVADSWHGKGIGTKLMRHCIFMAKEIGIKSLWGLVSLDNDRALQLAEEFGFKKIPDFGTGSFKLELDLETGRQEVRVSKGQDDAGERLDDPKRYHR